MTARERAIEILEDANASKDAKELAKMILREAPVVIPPRYIPQPVQPVPTAPVPPYFPRFPEPPWGPVWCGGT